jgi:hypothetical protein
MNIMKNRKLAIATAIILVLSMSASAALMPPTDAAARGWTWVSYAYLVVAPNPVGVDQTVAVVMWVDGALPGATVSNDIRRHDYTLTITDPDGQVETQTWDVVSDSTGMVYTQYTPTKVGNYTFHFEYPDQNYTWVPGGSNDVYQYDLFLGAERTQTLIVQQEQVPASKDSYPMPTEYWTRPIEGQNTYWYSITSNWLGTPYVIGAGASYGIPGAVQPDGAAPNSAHIMWTKGIQYGGIVGGNNTAVPGEMWYSGLSYNTRFGNPIIMQGTLFYQEPWGNAGGSGGLFGTGGEYVAVDLLTGKELWRVDTAATGISIVPSFGYLYSYEDPNQHGVLSNGILVAPYTAGGVTTPYGVMGGFPCWTAYEPRTGKLLPMNITNIPSGVAAKGPSGEYLIYTLTYNGSWYLGQWNSSRVFGGMQGMMGVGNWYSGTANASVASAYDWVKEISSLKGTGWSVGKASLGAIPLANPGDKLLLVQGGFGGHPGDYYATIPTVTVDKGNITAINLDPDVATVGNVLWSKTYDPAPGNNTRLITDWDPANDIFVFCDKEDMVHYGYSLSDGGKVWGPSALTDDYTTDYNFMAIGLERIAYGNLYFSGYAGILYCYNDQSGDLLWTYGNGGEGNSTNSGFETPYGRYPIFISTIADGKVYLTTSEHSPNSPLYKDSQLRCVNASNGAELWKIMDYGNQMYGGQSPVADGYLTTLNSYDSQIYCYGKGPSALTVSAPDIGVSLGTPIVIRGTATDLAPGAQQTEQAGRFPNGIPAVSDESMSSWMEYVYMQKPRPTDVTGIPIQIYVLDANMNYRMIGETTSDANGAYTYTWTPDIEGSYIVISSFAGSESFYPSQAESSFAVSSATPTQAPYPEVNVPSNEMYFVGSTVAIIIAIALATAIIIMRKK